MRLTKAGEYGVRIIHYLATNVPFGKVVSRKEICDAYDIPFHFFSKVAPLLARAGIVELVRGRDGGIKLKRLPENITLLDVIEAVIGEIFLNSCVINPESCRMNMECQVHQVWLEARERLRETLRSKTFKELGEKVC